MDFLNGDFLKTILLLSLIGLTGCGKKDFVTVTVNPGSGNTKSTPNLMKMLSQAPSLTTGPYTCVQPNPVLAAVLSNNDCNGSGGSTGSGGNDVTSIVSSPMTTTVVSPPSVVAAAADMMNGIIAGASMTLAHPLSLLIPSNTLTTIGMMGSFQFFDDGLGNVCGLPWSSSTVPVAPFVGCATVSMASSGAINIPVTMAGQKASLVLDPSQPSAPANSDIVNNNGRHNYILTFIELPMRGAYYPVSVSALKVTVHPGSASAEKTILPIVYPGTSLAISQNNSHYAIPNQSPAPPFPPNPSAVSGLGGITTFYGYALPHVFPMTFDFTFTDSNSGINSCLVNISDNQQSVAGSYERNSYNTASGVQMQTQAITVNLANCSYTP